MNNDDLTIIGKIVLWLLPPALITIILRGAFAALIRKLIFYCLDDDKDGIPILRSIIDKAYKDRKILIDNNTKATENNSNRLEAVEMAIQAHTHEISVLNESINDMPRWIDAVERIETYMKSFSSDMVEVRREVGKAREDIAEMRGRWDGIERRNTPRQGT